MIGKITSEMISRRWALSLLGCVGLRGGSDRPKAVRCQGPDGRGRAGATQSCFGFAGRRIARRFHVGRA